MAFERETCIALPFNTAQEKCPKLHEAVAILDHVRYSPLRAVIRPSMGGSSRIVTEPSMGGYTRLVLELFV